MNRLLTLIPILFGLLTSADAQPIIEWQRNMGGAQGDIPTGIEHTADNGSITIGYTGSVNGDVVANKGMTDVWLVKMNASSAVEWSKTYGGSGNENGNFIKQLPDEGYIFTGSTGSRDGDVTGSKGALDMWVVRIDKTGNILWQRCLGGSRNDAGLSLVVTADGGFAIAGVTQSTDKDVTGSKGNMDLWIVRLDASGNIVWTKTLGGSAKDDGAYSIKQTKDGGFIIGASTESVDGDVTFNKGVIDTWIVKLDNAGTLQWQKSYGGSQRDVFKGLAPATNGWWVLGNTGSRDGDVSLNKGNDDIWLFLIDEMGNLLFEKTFGGAGIDVANALEPTSDGGYIIHSGTNSIDGDICEFKYAFNIWLFKITGAGDLVWQKIFGGRSDDYLLYGRTVTSTRDGGYLFTCLSKSPDGDLTGNLGDTDYWIVKVDNGVRTGLAFTFSYPSPVCAGEGDILPGPSAGFETGGVYSYTGSGLMLDKSSGVIQPAASLPGIYEVNYRVNCPISYTTRATVTILPRPSATPFTFSYSSPVCGSAVFLPAVRGAGFPDGGRFFSASAGLSIDASTGVINPSASTPGIYTVGYERDAAACMPYMSAGTILEIKKADVVSTAFEYPNNFVCLDSGLQQPIKGSGFSEGGIFSVGSGMSLQSFTGTFDPRLSSAGTYDITYRVAAPSSCYSGTVSHTTSVTLYKCNCTLPVPNAFSPNQDGKNDFFSGIVAEGCLLEKYHLRIYNRWGNKIFESASPGTRWDGFYRNQMQPNGLYVYTLQFKFRDQPLKSTSGSFTLLR